MRHRERAICLRAIDYSETSQVVLFITRGQGLVRLMAKGTKRPKSKSGGAIDVMSEGDLVYADARQGMGTLMEFSETDVHTGLRRDFQRLNAVLFMVELSGSMIAEGDPHPEVFDLLHNAIARIDQEDAPIDAVLGYFQWRMLRHVGLLGGLECCVSCGVRLTGKTPADGDIYFSSRHGGLLCPDCQGTFGEKFLLDGACLCGIAAMSAAEEGKKVTLPQQQAQAVSKLLTYHIQQQLGKQLKMARHVQKKR